MGKIFSVGKAGDHAEGQDKRKKRIRGEPGLFAGS